MPTQGFREVYQEQHLLLEKYVLEWQVLVAGELTKLNELAKKQDLRAVYASTYDALKRKYGHWVIFEHCMPFDVTRAYDEASGITHPRIWTAQRDVAMWKALQR